MGSSDRSAAVRAEGPGEEHGPEPEALHRPAVAGLLALGMAVCLVVALVGLPREDAHLPAVARQALEVAVPRWHIAEPVNEVVYGTRGFDTFGETFLLLAAVVSVMTLTRRRESRHEGDSDQGRSGPGGASRRSSTLPRTRTRTGGAARASAASRRRRGSPSPTSSRIGADRTARGPIPTTSAWVRRRPSGPRRWAWSRGRPPAPRLRCWRSPPCTWPPRDTRPGGGFPAGAVLLGVILMLWAGFGHERMGRAIQQGPLESLELAGAVAIVGIAVLGLVLKGSVSSNWLPLAGSPTTIFSGGVLQAFSGSELIEVATGLTLAVFSLLAMRHDWTPDEAGATAPGAQAGAKGRSAGGASAGGASAGSAAAGSAAAGGGDRGGEG